MSDESTAQTGAEVVPAENAGNPPEQQQRQEGSEATAEQVEAGQQQGQPRDEKGRYVPQERVNEITKARRTAERNWEAAERRAQELEQRLSQMQGQQPQAQSNDIPTLEQFDWDQARWAQAVAEYATKSATTQAEQRLREQERARSQQDMATKFEERARAYSAEHPDYDRAIAELGASVRFPQEVIEAIGLSDHGPAVAHHLAQHLDVADRIARLPPHLAAVEIGRIEVRVSTPKPKPVTQAPQPGATLSGGSSSPNKIRAGMSYEDYKAARMGG